MRSEKHNHLVQSLVIDINLIGLFFRLRFINVDIKLQVFEYYAEKLMKIIIRGKAFVLLLLILVKSKSYPENFVCLTHKLRRRQNQIVPSFIFEDKSLEQAKSLLKAAWEKEDDSEIKAEIERRLLLLEPKEINQIKCIGCGKLFQSKRKRKFKNNFCVDCMKKRFGSRS